MGPPAGDILLRLPFRGRYDEGPFLDFLGARAVPGVEEAAEGTYRRTVMLPRGWGVVTVAPHPRAGRVSVRMRLEDRRDRAAAEQRCRHLLDLNTDPDAVAGVLGADPMLAPLVGLHPGLRVPGHVDGFELAVRAVLGQQVTVAGARTLAHRLVLKLGSALPSPAGALTHLWPSAEAVAGDDLAGIGLTGARIRTVRAVAEAVAEGLVVLDPDADRDETRRFLLALPGIGPWTADYIAMRALGDPDAIPLTDLGLRRAVASLGGPAEPQALAARAERWRPWRSYAAMHLWTHLTIPKHGGA